MADKTGIEWTDATLLDPLKWKTPRRIFVNSMSDLFHPGVTDEMLDRIFAVMALCPQHTFQVLTKRPERMLGYLTSRHLITRWGFWASDILKSGDEALKRYPGFPLPNVWLGVSVEDQKTADARVPPLLQTPAAVRFISAEPLLGPVDLERIVLKAAEFPERGQPPVSMRALTGWHGGCDRPERTKLDWVIVGGESGRGPGIRPMHPDWARSLRDQCVAAGVPFFFKQNGEYASVSEVAGAGVHHHFLDGATVRRVGKKAAGDLLDGRQWHEMPGARA